MNHAFTFYKAVLLLACPLVMAGLGHATPVYSSIDASGQKRWSTQALDAGYQPEPGFAIPNNEPRPTRNKGALERRKTQFRPLVEQIAQKHGVDSNLVMALIEVESGFNTKAVSVKGARGLMQLLPSTAAAYGMRNIKELHLPERNLEFGIRHLKDLLDQHQGQWVLALASYNAGPYAVQRHGQRIPAYRETMLYVPAVLAIAAKTTD